MHDEVTPYLLESVDESWRWRRCVDGEICRQVGTMVGRSNGILVFPALSAGSRKGFCEPVTGAGECDFAVKIPCALFLACGELGLVQSRRSAVAEGIEKRC